MKHILSLSALLMLLPATAEEATKEKSAAAKSAFAFPDRPHYVNIKPEAFDKSRRTNTNAVVLDVRTPEEYAKGHLPGAVLLDFKAADFATKLGALDPKKTYLVHCASGGRSAKACEQMYELGFPRVANLEGGFKAWEAAGKPVEK